MESVIKKYNPGGVDSSVLDRTGKGGLVSGGYLKEEPIRSYVGDEETVIFAVSNAKSGVEYEPEGSGGPTRVRPGDGYRAFAVVTDARLLFIVGDSENGDASGDYSASIPLADVAVVKEDSGVLTGELVVVTSAEMRWRFACRDDVSSVVDYVDAASTTWTRVETRLERARKRLVDATGHLETPAYDDALAAVRDATAETDAARERERRFCESGVPAIDSRIARIEDRIGEVRLRVMRGRGTHRMDVAETHWRDGKYDAAYEAYSGAAEDFREALELLDSGTTADELRKKLDRVRGSMDSLARAPIESARTAERSAREADAPGVRARHLERALDRYRTALALDWGREEKRFECDTETVRRRVDDVAESLVAARKSEAAEHIDDALDHCDQERYREALASYRDARKALEDARDVARELVPEAVETVTDGVDAVDERLEALVDEVDDTAADGVGSPSR